MYCTSCGEEVPDGSAFCQHCGKAFDSGKNPEREEGEIPTAEQKTENSETSTLKKLGYWGGRIGQAVLTFLAVVFVLGGINMNVIQFATLGIFSLVLLGFAGVIEVIIVRPSAK